MSKLSAFLNKSKKKGAAKAAETPLATQPGLAVASKVEQVAPVTLDVIQPKVLEQWGVEEDEVVEEVVASTERAASDEEDDEIDLPSSKVKGNFEWKKKSDDANAELMRAAEQAAKEKAEKEEELERKRKEQETGLVLRKKKDSKGKGPGDLEDIKQFPELGLNFKEAATPMTPAGVQPVKQKARKTAVKVNKPVTEEGKAEQARSKPLSAEDVWRVVGKWSAGVTWPRVAFDDTAARNRFQRILPTLC